MTAVPVGKALRAARRWLRRRGLDVVRYPPQEPVEAHLSALFRLLEIDCVLDVGAHVGDYGRMLRDFGYAGRIVSFEPVQANADELRERTDPNWLVVQKAVGFRAGSGPIKLTSGSQQHSFLSPNDYARLLSSKLFEPAGEETVEIVRLDDVFHGLVRPRERVFLKIDTQGLDFDVLRGAESSLGLVAGLQFELAPRHTYEGQPDYLEVLAWLRDREFEPTGIFPFFSDADLVLIEAECVCRRTAAADARRSP